jgi:hypothetical protein
MASVLRREVKLWNYRNLFSIFECTEEGSEIMEL